MLCSSPIANAISLRSNPLAGVGVTQAPAVESFLCKGGDD